jgi:Zn-dependent protease with chaperone function
MPRVVFSLSLISFLDFHIFYILYLLLLGPLFSFHEISFLLENLVGLRWQGRWTPSLIEVLFLLTCLFLSLFFTLFFLSSLFSLGSNNEPEKVFFLRSSRVTEHFR